MEDEDFATRAYLAMTLALALALGAALAGWVGGLGGDYNEFGWDTTEFVGIIATFLLVPVALGLTTKARSLGVPYVWRVLGWLLCLAGLLLPAALLGNTFLNAPGYDAFGCGALFDVDFYTNVSGEMRRVCDPIRAQRQGDVIFGAVVGGGVVVASGFSALRPSPTRVHAWRDSR